MAEWDLNGIKELMDKMAETGLGELRVKDGDFSLKLAAKQAPAPQVYAAPPASCAPLAAPVPAGTQAAECGAPAAKPVPEGTVVKAPIVGTFYASPAPDKPTFVQVGSKVKKGDVLFVIESMKLMNEIQSDCAGEIAELLVENGQGVEYNQPVLIIK